LLLRHPGIASRPFMMRETNGARCLSEMFRNCAVGRGFVENAVVERLPPALRGRFPATPHEVSRDLAPKLLDAGLRVIDLSGAFRFASADTYLHQVQAARASCFAPGRGGLWPAGTLRRANLNAPDDALHQHWRSAPRRGWIRVRPAAPALWSRNTTKAAQCSDAELRT